MNNYESDKFNKVIKDKVNDIKIDIPDTLKNNILKTLDELPERKTKKKKQAEKYIQSSSDNYSWYINFKYIYACICRKLTNNRGYF